MKNLIKTFLALCAAGAAQMAGAANYTPGDLLLVFHQTGFNDVVYDIGSVSSFTGLPAGTVVPVSYSTSLVKGNFGGSLSGLKFAVVGENDAQSYLWLTDANTVSTPSDLTIGTYAPLQGKVSGVGSGVNTLAPLVVDPSLANSYSYIVSPLDAGSVGSMGGDSSFQVSSAYIYTAAFYRLIPTTFSPQPSALKLGTFTMAVGGAVTYTAAPVTPVVTSITGPGTVARGGTATYTATAEGATGFQWYLNGVAIAGATSSTLTVPNVQPGNIGNYTVVASNSTYSTASTASVAKVLKTTPAYLPGDALLVFHDGSNPDVVFNLGSITNFTGQTLLTTRSLNYNRAAVLANFGSLTGVQVSLIAANDGVNTVWMSDADASGVPTDLTLNTYATLVGKIDSAGSTLTTLDYNNPLILASSAANSYSSIVSPGDAASVNTFGGDAPFNVGASISGGGNAAFRLYALHPTVGAPGLATLLGYLDMAAAGSDLAFSAVTTLDSGASPTLTITAPKAAAKIGGTNNANAVVVTGTAKDDSLVAAVKYSLNGSAFANATLVDTNWSVANLPFIIGSNSIAIKSIDAAGHESAVTNRALFYSAYSTLTLLTNGNGGVTPNLSGMNLLVGKPVVLAAVPAADSLPKNWVSIVGSASTVVSTGSKYSFIPTTSPATLVANFVTNQFLAEAGSSFNGLMSEAGGVAYDSAGFFTVKITAAPTSMAAFSGSFLLSGEKVKFAGIFDDLAGTGHNFKPVQLLSDPSQTYAVTLTLPFDGSDTISGVVSNKSTHKVSSMSGDKALPNTNYAGNYTIIFPATNVVGDGYGLVNISTNGTIKLGGNLGDGSVIKQKVSISKNGQWPLFVSANPAVVGGVNVNAGFLMGWVDVTTNDFSNTSYWIKQPVAGDPYYPGGFTNTVEMVGSSYTNSALFTNRVITLTGGSNGVVLMQDGNLTIATTNQVFLSLLNKFTAPATNSVGVTNKLALSLTTKSGKLTGSFLRDGVTPAKLTGAVLQRDGSGSGFFKGTDHTGLFLLQGN